MNHVLYEASSFAFHELYLTIAMLIIYLIILPSLAQRLYNDPRVKKRENWTDIHIKRIFTIGSIVGILAVAAFVIPIILRQIDMYDKIVKAYQLGNYEVVEGYVENFKPVPNEGRKGESFDINGVSFSYVNNEIMQGYNHIQADGGVITGDGQHLRIGYIYYNKTYGNIIVYIEELD